MNSKESRKIYSLSNLELNVIRALSIVFAVYSFWLSTNRTWQPDFAHAINPFGSDYFRNQANSLIHGHLWVPTTSGNNECFFRDGKCFGYFGIFPSILRIPLFMIVPSTSVSFSPISIAVAAGLSMWAILQIAWTAMWSSKTFLESQSDRLLIICVTALFLGFASPLVMLSQSKLYREAIIWMVASTLIAIASFLQWSLTRERRYLVILLLSGIIATNSRPTSLPIMAGLGMWVIFEHAKIHGRRKIGLPLLILLLPSMTCLGVMYLKFHSFTPPWESYVWIDTFLSDIYRANHGQMSGLRFIATNLAQYFRPDSVSYSLSSPWVKTPVPSQKPPIIIEPVIRKAVFTDGVVSVTNAYPFQLILTVGFVGQTARKFFRPNGTSGVFPFILLIISGSSLALTLTTFSTDTRYLGDFYPMLVVGTIFGGMNLCSWLTSRGYLRTTLYGIVPLGVYFCFVQYALNIGGWDTLG